MFRFSFASWRLGVSFAVVLAFGLLTASPSLSDDAPAELPKFKFRVVGLFMPDREEDLKQVMQDLPEVKLLSVDYAASEAEFQFDADKLFNKPRPEQVLERLDNLIKNHSNYTFGLRACCTKPRDKLEMIEIPVAGLDCKACSYACYLYVNGIDGVERATASFKEGLVTALVDPAKTNREAIVAFLKQRNVDVKTPEESATK